MGGAYSTHEMDEKLIIQYFGSQIWREEITRKTLA